jgi:D-glycero-D-manno-heptose 1,7-bisphosphate phosphatase
MSFTRGRAGVFLDRDGVLNELVPDPASGVPESPLSVADVRLAAGAAAAAARLRALGFALVCVSNQPAAAKGKVSVDQLLSVHHRVLELLAEQGVTLAASYLCMHHEHGVVPELSGPCDCRKPAPGMLLDGARDLALDPGVSWMVGDTDADVAAGEAAGCMTLLIRNSGSAHKRLQAVAPDLLADSLADGVARLAGRMSETIGLNQCRYGDVPVGEDHHAGSDHDTHIR